MKTVLSFSAQKCPGGCGIGLVATQLESGGGVDVTKSRVCMIFTPVGRLKSFIPSHFLQKIMHSATYDAGAFPKIAHTTAFAAAAEH